MTAHGPDPILTDLVSRVEELEENGGGGGGGPESDPIALAALTDHDLDTDAHALLFAAEVAARNSAITAAVAALVNGAPGALDTLKEIADRLTADDADQDTIAATLNSLITTVAGKANATHTHAQSDVTGLVAALAAKATKVSLRDTILAATPAIYWPLDATYGVADQSGNARNGTGAGSISIGTAAGMDGTANAATTFNGSTHRITAGWSPYVAGGAQTFVVSAYLSTARNYQCIFGGGANTPFLPFLRPSEMHLEGYTGAGSGIINDAFPYLNEWVRLAICFDDANDRMLFYVNGSPVGGKIVSASYGATPGNLQISGGNGAFNLWQGRLEDMAIYSRILTPAEIHKDYLAGIGALFA